MPASATASTWLRDWLRFGEHGAEDVWPRRWAEAYVSGCREQVYDWLRGHGVKFFPVVHWVERGLHGGGNPLPRFHIVWGTGERLVLALLERLESHPHRGRMLLLHRHRVTDLESVNGAFVGCSGVVESEDADGDQPDGRQAAGEFAAEGDCLVIAAGGICGNLALVREHWHADWRTPPETLLNGSHPTAEGDVVHGTVRGSRRSYCIRQDELTESRRTRMGVDRYGVDRTGLQPPGNEPTMVQAGLALAGVLAAVLLVAVSLLSTTATVNAASHPTIQAQQAGVPTSHAAIQRGVGWLKTNQRAEGYWWTQSLRNSFDTSNFLTHAGTTFALKALAVTELETEGVADAEH